MGKTPFIISMKNLHKHPELVVVVVVGSVTGLFADQSVTETRPINASNVESKPNACKKESRDVNAWEIT